MKIKFITSALFVLSLSCSKSGGSTEQTQADPKISIADISQAEGNGGTSSFQLEFRLDHASSKTVTVSYTTIEGTAKATSDFTVANAQLVTFQPNETTKSVSIPIVADDIEEGDEQFSVVLSNPSNASISQGTSVITIINDDTKAAFNNTGYDAPTSYTGYNLVWKDEFDGTSLDQSAWTYEIGNNNGWGNHELEYYTDRPKNVTIQDGKLVIHALNEPFSGFNYTSARIKTQAKKEFQYGRVDIRALLPKGQGIWPALWMLGSNISTVGWPSCGEIDMMEMLGHEPSKIYGTLHYNTPSGHGQKGSFYNIPGANSNEQFHVYSMEWKQDQIKLFVDNNLYLTVNASDVGTANWPFNQKFFFIFNLAVGGDWPKSPDATTTFPQWMVVDYIRVYQ